MQVIVCGAGQVGSNIARYLATEGNDVTVIDQRADLIRKLSEQLDVRGLVGHASHPDVLEAAGAQDADLIVAVTYADEVNMVACQVAHSLFDVPTKIARVRAQAYLQTEWSSLFSRDHMPIDHIISPEIEVAKHIHLQLQVPGAFDMLQMADGLVRVVGVRCSDDCPITDTPLDQLETMFPELHLTVFAIIRNDKPIVPKSEDRLLAGDEVFFITETSQLARCMAAFGHQEREARRIVIAGGGNIGSSLAALITKHQPSVSVKILEYNAEKAREVAGMLDRVTVLNGDALDPEVLEEANVPEAETFVAVSNDDEVNLIASLLAKRNGCERAVALINNQNYGGLVTNLGIDAVVDPRAITVSTILQHVRRGRVRAVHSLREGLGEVIEAEALETAQIVGKPLKDIKLPTGILIGAVIRGQSVLTPRGETVIQDKDRVILFAASGMSKKVEKAFAVRLEYF
ncbi:MAG: Trk system potassium transporter TrkA [Alphaproteobacteria bacterium]|nr:Trk system potassium transporter TrkA [Alphaproteobacteria bacterium]